MLYSNIIMVLPWQIDGLRNVALKYWKRIDNLPLFGDTAF